MTMPALHPSFLVTFELIKNNNTCDKTVVLEGDLNVDVSRPNADWVLAVLSGLAVGIVLHRQ